eukprot:CAMPEP_0169075372 /NCGR_PEP_ID=MMETSP1015-20121227/7787_1 /TAXON_ID=342587 /ORGANISM="Karlodinium micrum, Strain CCMP2283" /LENGTH=144 /DNA_ID=CAMNT_0009134779 /DNA_START=323 /DNA_END=757 /DNA_ORIENTATION=+
MRASTSSTASTKALDKSISSVEDTLASLASSICGNKTSTSDATSLPPCPSKTPKMPKSFPLLEIVAAMCVSSMDDLHPRIDALTHLTFELSKRLPNEHVPFSTETSLSGTSSLSKTPTQASKRDANNPRAAANLARPEKAFVTR